MALLADRHVTVAIRNPVDIIHLSDLDNYILSIFHNLGSSRGEIFKNEMNPSKK